MDHSLSNTPSLDVNHPISLQQSVTVNDVLYLITLSTIPSTSFSLSLLCPSTAITYSNTFTAPYISSLTSKAHHALPFNSFLSLLVSSLSSSSSSISLDILSSSDIHLLRSRHISSSSSSSSSSFTSSLPFNDRKRYLIVTHSIDNRLVHYPLPLVQGQDPVGVKREEEGGGKTGLSVLTEVIAQLSAALKEARREVRAEREKRKQREEEEKAERDAMRAEIAEMKRRMKDRDDKEERIESGEVEMMRQKWKKEERLRQATEAELRRWRTRCERLEAEVQHLRGERKGRGRERTVQKAAVRSIGSRSTSPSYVRPTSATQSNRSSSPATSARLPRPVSPRLTSSTASSRARSRSPSPAAAWNERNGSPASRERERKRFDPSEWLRERQEKEKERRKERKAFTGHSSPRAATHKTESLSHSFSHTPSSPQHSLSLKAKPLAVQSSRQVERRKEEEVRGEEQKEEERRGDEVEGSRGGGGVQEGFTGIRPSRTVDVHSRLSALQTFLRAEKEKIAALSRNH